MQVTCALSLPLSLFLSLSLSLSLSPVRVVLHTETLALAVQTVQKVCLQGPVAWQHLPMQ